MKGILLPILFCIGLFTYCQSQELFWTDDLDFKIRKANADGSGSVTTVYDLPFLITGQLPGGIDYDSDTDKIYFGHNSGRRIQRMNTDGSNVQNIQILSSGPRGVVVDNGNAYWVLSGSLSKGGKTPSSNDGSVLQSGLSQATGLDLDGSNNRLYYTNGFGSGSDAIGRIGTDGSGGNTSLVGLGSNAPLAVVVAGSFIYWTEFNTNKVRRANLDGSGAIDLITSGLNGPRALTVDESAGFIYIGNFNAETISRAPLSGGAATTLFSSVGWPVALTIVPAPLPVEMVSFRAETQGEDVALHWATASEINNAFFDIQHSTDGLHFTPIARINGQGNSSITHHYHYLHKSPERKVNYYKIKQVDEDGSHAFSSIVVATLNTAKRHFSVSPNPFSTHLDLQMQRPLLHPATVELFDLHGKQVYSGTMPAANTEHRIALATLPNGLYILKIESEGEVFSEKIMKVN